MRNAKLNSRDDKGCLMRYLRPYVKRHCTLLLCALVCALPLPAQAIEYRTVEVAAVLYDAPSQKGQKRFVIKRSTPVELVVNLEAWAKVRDADGTVAWIEKKYLAERRSVVVTVARAKIKQSPDETAPLVFEALKGVGLDYLESLPNAWLKVRHRDGQVGFVRADQVWGG
ncbi:MAG: SH3 domain-containing protein [Pseudomonadota bacterium]